MVGGLFVAAPDGHATGPRRTHGGHLHRRPASSSLLRLLAAGGGALVLTICLAAGIGWRAVHHVSLFLGVGEHSRRRARHPCRFVFFLGQAEHARTFARTKPSHIMM